MDIIGSLMTIVIALSFMILYLIPGLIADNRGHKDRSAIMVLNVFLGWTFFGWVIALVWACTGPNRKKILKGALCPSTEPPKNPTPPRT